MDEEFVVVLSDAVADPGAMVVHTEITALAVFAVMGARRADYIAFVAESGHFEVGHCCL